MNWAGVIQSIANSTDWPSLPTGVALTISSAFRTRSDNDPSGAGPPLVTSRSRQTVLASSRSGLVTQIFAAVSRSASARSPSPSPPSTNSRVWPLLEAVLLEEASELFVGLGVVVVTLGVGEVEEVPGVRGLERGIDGFDARVGDRSRWKAGM